MKLRNGAGLFLSVVILCGCAAYKLVGPERHEITGVYFVEPQIAWSARQYGEKMEVWTVDGLQLEAVFFLKGLKDGEPLLYVKERGGSKHPPEFKSYMNANEVLELFVASLTYAGRGQVQVKDLRPAPFGKAPGYRFEYSYLTVDGLEMEGFALGAVLNAKLFLIMYEGSSQYYFEKYRADVEKLIASISLL